jgi:hypothetical protein
MGLHTGVATVQREGDYFGPTVNKVARISSAAHGGQIILSASTALLVEPQLYAEELPRVSTTTVVTATPTSISITSLRDLGIHRFKDLNEPEQIFQLVATDLPNEFEAIKSLEVISNNRSNLSSTTSNNQEALASTKKVATTTPLDNLAEQVQLIGVITY